MPNKIAIALLLLLSLGVLYGYAQVAPDNAAAVAPAAPEKPAPAAYRVGLAQVDITPDPSTMAIPLNGYGDRGRKPATGVLDPLYAKALVVADPAGNLLGVVALDLCFVNSEVHDTVVERLKPLGFDEHHLLLSATHTHSAYAGYDRRWIARKAMGEFNPQLFELVVRGIVSAVTAAKQNLRPAAIEYGYSDLKEMNRSRRDPSFDVGIGGMPPDIKPNPEKYPTNPRLYILRFTGADGRILGALVNYASHPTILSPKNFKFSADWPGVMCGRVQEKLGPGSVVMFLNGALGDAAPKPDWADLDQEIKQFHEYGAQMADNVRQTLEHLQPMSKQVVDGFVARRDVSNVIVRPLCRLWLPRWITKIAFLRPDAPVQAVRLGDFMLLALPGEPTTAVGKMMENLAPAGSIPLVVAPANDYYGYFVTKTEYAEGGYAADSCLYGPDTAQKFADVMATAIGVLQTSR